MTHDTKMHKPALKIEQENAIDLLILGKTDAEVGQTVGVRREQIWRWRNEHPYFQAELNRRRADLWRGAQERLRHLVGQAVDVIETAVKGGDLRAAVELLKACKLYGEVGAPTGHTDPDAILWAKADALARRELGDKDPLERMMDEHGERIRKRTEAIMDELREDFETSG